MVDFDVLNTANAPLFIEPRDVFYALPSNPEVNFLRGAEGPVVVWWFRKRASRDGVIKSVTGEGKSVVGLRAARPRKDFGCA